MNVINSFQHKLSFAISAQHLFCLSFSNSFDYTKSPHFLDDTENSMTQRTHHRQFLKEKSVFKKIINIEDESIIAKIQINYRLNYLKDSVVSSYIDEQAGKYIQHSNLTLVKA